MDNPVKNGRKSSKKGYRIVFLSALLISVLFECLVFLHTQIDKVKGIIERDFRVIVVTSSDKNVEAIKRELAEIAGVKSVVFVPSAETLKRIENSDKELYSSVATIGKNPIPDIMELEVEQGVLGDVEDFIDKLIKIDGVIDIKYKILEAYALLHFSFYSNFISVIISFAALMVIVLVFMGIMHVGVSNFFGSVRHSFRWFLAGALGSVCAVVFTYAIVYPVKYLSPIWEWPSGAWHLFLVLACGLVAWVLYQWKESQ